MHWKRTIAWSALIFLAALVVGISVNFLFGSDTLASAGIFASSSLLYFAFLRRLPKRLLHALAAFLIVEAIDWSMAFGLGAPLSELLADWGSTAKHLGAVLVGLTAASLSSNNSFKPKPLRGSA